jgi:hypothetical protein
MDDITKVKYVGYAGGRFLLFAFVRLPVLVVARDGFLLFASVRMPVLLMGHELFFSGSKERRERKRN